MSLLMDALRKAEADKKQASTENRGAHAPTREYRRFDDTEPDATIPKPDEATAPGAPTKSAPEPQAPRLQDPGLSLEPLEIEISADDSAMPVGSSGATLRARPDPGSTGPSTRGVESRRETPFDDSQTLWVPDPEAAGATPEAIAPGTSSRITETVASAHTIFDAGMAGPSKRVIVWGFAITIVIGCVLSGAGFYYFQRAPTAHQIPSPSVALNVEKSLPEELPTRPLEPTSKLPAATIVRVGPSTATGESSESHIAEGIEPRSAADPDTAAVDGPAATLEAMAIEPKSAVGSTAEPLPMSADEAVYVPRAPEVGVRPGEVRIARSDRSGKTGATVNQAYAAYVAGQYEQAEELYRHVLSQRPEQRDALLGLAALRLRAGDVASAHRLYRQVLKRDPNNPTASAAMFSLEGGVGDQVTESRLKMLLDEGVDVGYVYFSLGNLYARNNRWADAQLAYFEALRNTPENPDYNYNLAVSLDRIGQRTAAVKYYNAALGFTDAGQAAFDPARALARIHTINAETSP